jgi:hypothetical protein
MKDAFGRQRRVEDNAALPTPRGSGFETQNFPPTNSLSEKFFTLIFFGATLRSTQSAPSL